jgi:hypothetical protein
MIRRQTLEPAAGGRWSQMQLKEVVAKYLALAGSYGKAVPLAEFGLSRDETVRVFSVFDEDYLISRFMHFTNSVGAVYFEINGFPQTHLTIEAEIEKVL